MPPTPSLPGPYQSVREASADADDIWQATRDKVRTAGRAMRRERLVDACRDTAVEVGAYDDEILIWLAEYATNEAVQSITGLIRRAHAAGHTSSITSELVDGKVHVYDTRTGTTVWEGRLDDPGPSTDREREGA